MDINDVLNGPVTPDIFSIREHYRFKANTRRIRDNLEEKATEYVCDALVENKKLKADLKDAIGLLQTLWSIVMLTADLKIPYEYRLTAEAAEKKLKERGWYKE